MNIALNTDILAPAAVLIAWSMVMMGWVVVTRLAAFSKAGINIAEGEPGARYVDIEPSMPASVNWKAHNFNHLMEQPTIFYAVVAVLAIAGAPAATVTWAWVYVGFRVLHSLWQSLVNTVPVRFLLFAGSNICLLALTVYAVRITLGV